jgi:hypothetical protein
MRTAERTKAKALAIRFLDGAKAALAPFEIYSDTHDALWHGYFDPLRPFIDYGDFVMDHPLARPHPLQLFVESYIFYGWFRAWVRKQGIDPATLKIPTGYPFTTAFDKTYPDDDGED